MGKKEDIQALQDMYLAIGRLVARRKTLGDFDANAAAILLLAESMLKVSELLLDVIHDSGPDKN